MSPRAFTLLLDSLTPDTQTALARAIANSRRRCRLTGPRARHCRAGRRRPVLPADPPRNASNRQSGVYVATGIGRRTRMSADFDRHLHPRDRSRGGGDEQHRRWTRLGVPEAQSGPYRGLVDMGVGDPACAGRALSGPHADACGPGSCGVGSSGLGRPAGGGRCGVAVLVRRSDSGGRADARERNLCRASGAGGHPVGGTAPGHRQCHDSQGRAGQRGGTAADRRRGCLRYCRRCCSGYACGSQVES